jgi:hypothetical protein
MPQVISPMVQIEPGHHVRLDQILEVRSIRTNEPPPEKPKLAEIRLADGSYRYSTWKASTVLRRINAAGLAWVGDQVVAEWRVLSITRIGVPTIPPEPATEEKPEPRFLGSR